jgi:transposase-like protein
MKLPCPYCFCASVDHPNTVRFGTFHRRSDSTTVHRYQCKDCFKTFSSATHKPEYRQKKRQLNRSIRSLFASGVSLRRISLLLRLSRTTTARKLVFLGSQAKLRFIDQLLQLDNPVAEFQFDDLETFEHTKCKPVSITLAVEKGKRKILGFSVSTMAAKGHLAKIAKKKYGFRKDTRALGREKLFTHLIKVAKPTAVINSDENPYYITQVRKYFPQAEYNMFKGQRGAITGQGELKKVKFDPLFSLNHTCAMFRANVNRLFRKTWCTTKRIDRLEHHLYLYAEFHNSRLI